MTIEQILSFLSLVEEEEVQAEEKVYQVDKYTAALTCIAAVIDMYHLCLVLSSCSIKISIHSHIYWCISIQPLCKYNLLEKLTINVLSVSWCNKIIGHSFSFLFVFIAKCVQINFLPSLNSLFKRWSDFVKMKKYNRYKWMCEQSSICQRQIIVCIEICIKLIWFDNRCTLKLQKREMQMKKVIRVSFNF